MQPYILHAIHIWCIVHVQVLHETQLVETFNLRAAIEYQLKNCTLKPHILAIYYTYPISSHSWNSTGCTHRHASTIWGGTCIHIYIVSHLTSVHFSIGAGPSDPTQPGTYEHGERSNKWLWETTVPPAASPLSTWWGLNSSRLHHTTQQSDTWACTITPLYILSQIGSCLEVLVWK